MGGSAAAILATTAGESGSSTTTSSKAEASTGADPLMASSISRPDRRKLDVGAHREMIRDALPDDRAAQEAKPGVGQDPVDAHPGALLGGEGVAESGPGLGEGVVVVAQVVA